MILPWLHAELYANIAPAWKVAGLDRKSHT